MKIVSADECCRYVSIVLGGKAFRQLPWHVERGDLEVAGIIGFMEACRTYDSAKNSDFFSYAYRRVIGEMTSTMRSGMRVVRDGKWCVYMPTLLSLDITLPDVFYDFAPYGFSPHWHENLKIQPNDDDVMLLERLRLAIKKLSDREQLILYFYYGEDLTMEDIGRAFNVTESRISQQHRESILRLRSLLKVPAKTRQTDTNK